MCQQKRETNKNEKRRQGLVVSASTVTLGVGVVHGVTGYFYTYKDTP